MYGFNLATYRARILREIEGYGGPNASDNLADQVIFEALNEAQSHVQEILHFFHKVNSTTSVVANQQAYNVDATTHGRRLWSVWFKATATSDFVKLDEVPFRRAYDDGLIQNSETGTPTRWCWDEASPGQILLLPTPDTSVTNGLQYHYESAPRTLWRIEDSTGISLANVTHDSQSITLTDLNGTPLNGNAVFIGYEMGMYSTDSSCRPQLPLLWYEITNVVTSTVTITPAYEDLTDTGLSFVIAQVSDLEKAHRNKLRFALADMAAATLLDATAPERAIVLRTRAKETLDQALPDQNNATPRGRRIGRSQFYND